MKRKSAPGILVPVILAVAMLLSVPATVFVFYKIDSAKTLELAPILGPTMAFMGVIVAFISALYVTRRAAIAQRETAKILETYRSIAGKIWDKDYIDARLLFLKAANSDRDLSIYVDSNNIKFDEERKTQQSINSLANDYETTAIAILQDVFDEEFYKEWFKTSFVQDYNVLLPYILELRRVYKSPNLYKNFEEVATTWAKEIPPSLLGMIGNSNSK